MSLLQMVTNRDAAAAGHAGDGDADENDDVYVGDNGVGDNGNACGTSNGDGDGERSPCHRPIGRNLFHGMNH